MDTCKILIFLQNITGPHQIDFLRGLLDFHKIILVVDQAQDTHRKKDGWIIPKYSFLDVVIKPDNKKINQLFKDEKEIHIFSLVASFYFKEILNYTFIILIKNQLLHG